MHPQTLLAYEMNDEPLNDLHGAPLRLRVENQLGFKMVKWIQAIEFVESHKVDRRGRRRLHTRTTSTSANWPTSDSARQ